MNRMINWLSGRLTRGFGAVVARPLAYVIFFVAVAVCVIALLSLVWLGGVMSGYRKASAQRAVAPIARHQPQAIQRPTPVQSVVAPSIGSSEELARIEKRIAELVKVVKEDAEERAALKAEVEVLRADLQAAKRGLELSPRPSYVPPKRVNVVPSDCSSIADKVQRQRCEAWAPFRKR